MQYDAKISPDAAEKGMLTDKNASTLSREITWFSQFVNQRLTIYFPKETSQTFTDTAVVVPEEKSESWWKKAKQIKPTAILLSLIHI